MSAPLHVLVTGAGGYIGTTLVPMLLAAGHRVRALDRFFFGAELLAPHPGLEKIEKDARLISERDLAGIDAVIDLVAISNDPSGELFQEATWQINHRARLRTAKLAGAMGVGRYILPSSCSIYGFQDPAVVCDESHPTRPLTTYARANEAAEQDILPLHGRDFSVTVLRQATVYGYSPRMRFDLAINGMTWGAWSEGVLPLMRDGSQWRPMVHVQDTAAAQIFMLTAPVDRIGGRIFNVGSAGNNYQLGPLAEEVRRTLPRPVEIAWYGDPDHRSYRVAFDRIEALGWRAERHAADGVREIHARIVAGTLGRTSRTITLDWYRELAAAGDLFDLPAEAAAS